MLTQSSNVKPERHTQASERPVASTFSTRLQHKLDQIVTERSQVSTDELRAAYAEGQAEEV